ncbi:alpha/beta hydrolase [Paenibacillus psychroresistens]|uniref:Alpha/beta hydrolase n=1 Tax=Paenibacillus psychroresistens TaxID=1778678 RepID=A0A6B8RMK3_9BACL|nr:alpha/beta hydrolase [Paenibacillus psychroresistens]QGQ96912.1 alpha/beta hydrolase [Paenibacillus psychroresistens]
MITNNDGIPSEDFSDFKKIEFQFEGRDAILVCPDEEIKTRKWLLKTEYFAAFPGLEVEMLKRGWHVAYLKNTNRWGLDEDMDAKKAFAGFLNEKYGLYEKCVPVGMSAGGLHAIKLAAKYPEMVSSLYLDAPLLNILSCLNLAGTSIPNEALKEEVLSALNLTLSELISYREHPLDKLPALLASRIPVVLVYGSNDNIVPFHENGALLVKAYEHTGIDLEVYSKDCGHHPHCLDDPTQIIDFILRHAE